jgi:hypothetical protein
MAPLAGKHTFGSIGETRVTFIEKKIDAIRRDFLKILLEHNGLEVVIDVHEPKTPEEPELYTVGVTDMIFNPTIAIFERNFKTLDNKIATQDYWFQRSEEVPPQYWEND